MNKEHRPDVDKRQDTIHDVLKRIHLSDEAIPVDALTYPRPDLPRSARLELGDRVLYVDDYDEDAEPDPSMCTWAIYEEDGSAPGRRQIVELNGGPVADGEAAVLRFINEWKGART